MNRTLARATDAVLVAAVALDVFLFVMTWVWPELWFRGFHGTDGDAALYPFLRRCGAHWAAFALFQILALVRWRASILWLPVVAGMRLSDLFTDLTYVAASETVTPLGRLTLLAPFWLNLAMATLLLVAFHGALKASGTALAPVRGV